jgi:carboxyl-terminal processing protease
MKADMYRSLKEHTAGAFGGIGVTMGFKDNKVTIVSVLEGTPGEAAGLKANDEIVAVDDVPVSEYQPEEVSMHIRGEVGTEVKLTIHRAGSENEDYTIKRDTITIRSAKGKMLEGTEMGYIRIASFGENTGKEFQEEFQKLEEAGMKGLIIDLRENPGGLIKSCVEVANMVVPKGPIVSVVQRDGSKEEHDSNLEAPKVPVVVLIDGNSASASEILAGAIKDYKKGTLMGTTTFGKGIVQQLFTMTDGSAVKLTVSHYYTPNGNDIHKVGIEPDVEIKFDAEAYKADKTDNQLDAAIEYLSK